MPFLFGALGQVNQSAAASFATESVLNINHAQPIDYTTGRQRRNDGGRMGAFDAALTNKSARSTMLRALLFVRDITGNNALLTFDCASVTKLQSN